MEIILRVCFRLSNDSHAMYFRSVLVNDMQPLHLKSDHYWDTPLLWPLLWPLLSILFRIEKNKFSEIFFFTFSKKVMVFERWFFWKTSNIFFFFKMMKNVQKMDPLPKNFLKKKDKKHCSEKHFPCFESKHFQKK